jgi:ParB-like chromosome segregation protein Spo0J
MPLIEWLKSEIDARGTTQVEIARALGWSESKISKILNRVRTLTAEEFVDVMRLFGWPAPTDDTPVARLVRAAAVLAPEDVAHITRLSERLAQGNQSGP